jgi:hypothetical protein
MYKFVVYNCEICHAITVRIANDVFSILSSILALYETISRTPYELMDPLFRTVTEELWHMAST